MWLEANDPYGVGRYWIHAENGETLQDLHVGSVLVIYIIYVYIIDHNIINLFIFYLTQYISCTKCLK